MKSWKARSQAHAAIRPARRARRASTAKVIAEYAQSYLKTMAKQGMAGEAMKGRGAETVPEMMAGPAALEMAGSEEARKHLCAGSISCRHRQARKHQ